MLWLNVSILKLNFSELILEVSLIKNFSYFVLLIFMLFPIKFLLTPKSHHTVCTYNKKAFQNWKTFAEREEA